MARSWRGSRLMALLLSTAIATSAQTATTSPSGATTSAPSSTPTSTDIALSLWSDANSLLTSYYPSTSLTAVNTLTWPSTVVIGSSTYSVPAATASSATTSVLAEQTSGPSASPKPMGSDKKLGIVIGCVVGAVVLAILTFIFCLLSRRKKANGTYFLRRPSTRSRRESDDGAWRQPQRFEPASDRPPHDWVDSYSRLPVQAQPPMSMHPAYVRQHSSRSTSEDNPFFTPQERLDDVDLNHHELEGAGVAGGHHNNPYDIEAQYPSNDTHYPSNDTHHQEGRPSTPFSPMMMMHGGDLHQPQRNHNPFTSPDDDEADDIISPIIPARSPERRHSPMVHYPSWTEVSEFDFSGTGRNPRSALNHSSSDESGGDGYRPNHPNRRESVVGRHELA